MGGKAFPILVLVALAVGGLYVGRETPVVAASVVLLAIAALWLFWFAWLEYRQERRQ